MLFRYPSLWESWDHVVSSLQFEQMCVVQCVLAQATNTFHEIRTTRRGQAKLEPSQMRVSDRRDVKCYLEVQEVRMWSKTGAIAPLGKGQNFCLWFLCCAWDIWTADELIEKWEKPSLEFKAGHGYQIVLALEEEFMGVHFTAWPFETVSACISPSLFFTAQFVLHCHSTYNAFSHLLIDLLLHWAYSPGKWQFHRTEFINMFLNSLLVPLTYELCGQHPESRLAVGSQVWEWVGYIWESWKGSWWWWLCWKQLQGE